MRSIDQQIKTLEMKIKIEEDVLNRNSFPNKKYYIEEMLKRHKEELNILKEKEIKNDNQFCEFKNRGN